VAVSTFFLMSGLAMLRGSHSPSWRPRPPDENPTVSSVSAPPCSDATVRPQKHKKVVRFAATLESVHMHPRVLDTVSKP